MEGWRQCEDEGCEHFCSDVQPVGRSLVLVVQASLNCQNVLHCGVWDVSIDLTTKVHTTDYAAFILFPPPFLHNHTASVA